jgi:glycerophosphoryl diester phosphodiesterase
MHRRLNQQSGKDRGRRHPPTIRFVTAPPRLLRRLAFGAAAAACSCSTAAEVSLVCPPSAFRSTPPSVIAHAGGEGLGPANTILAMQRSLDAGADILDADLRMTADGVIVAAHDRNLSAAAGHSGNVDEMSWEDLQQLDLRPGWTGATIDAPVRVPSLEQILTAFPDETISLEIKQVSPSISDELCRALTASDSVGRVYLSANDDAAVYEARDRCPRVLITTTYTDLADMRSARDAGTPMCAPAPIGQPPYREGRFDRESVRRLHDQGTAIFTWTVDDPEALRNLAEAGVDGVYTRRPDIARAVFDRFADERDAEGG